MSQAGSPNIQKPKNPGCSSFGLWVALIGFGGMIIIGLLLAGYTLYQIQTEGLDLFGTQAPEVEQPVDEPPPEGSPPKPPDSANFDPASCLPQPGDYSLEIQNLNDRTSTNGNRSCGADGMITNNSNQALAFAIFRVNNYGAAETRYPEGKWGYSSQTIEPGETIEYGRFHRCTGGVCDAGEWFYIQRISILYTAPGCSEYANSFEDKPPESIVPVENPCSW